jgi:pyridoxine 4-dehydrogenase
LPISSAQPTAAAAGTWKLGDLVVNRMGFGAMRLTQLTPGEMARLGSLPADPA